MRIERIWAMPNKETFKILPIKDLLSQETDGYVNWVDPFSGSSNLAEAFNDLNPQFEAQWRMDGLDFLRMFSDSSISGVLFDPPYSPRQLAECYKSIGKSLTTEDTQSKYWAKVKDEIARIVMPSGKCISFGWNSGGIGINRGFEISRILLVPHGGWHNDTIVTVERKLPRLL